MKILIVSDCGVPTGYGRIADEIGKRLVARGHIVQALSYYYDGLLPAQYDGAILPYHVGVLVGKLDPVGDICRVINVMLPDIVLSAQDFPYHAQLFHDARVDWSKFGRVLITPVDGVPIEPSWLDLLGHVDAAMTISQFGVDSFADAGHQVGLCRPGINLDRFCQQPDHQRAENRAKLGLIPEQFVLGTMAQNQGRKAITLMLKGFFAFAKGKPDARYILDMDETSPAGWNLPNIIKQQGWDASKVLFRSDCVRAGVVELVDRYNLLDAHAVLAHREGYGLPLVEAMACGVVSMAMDYCSGPEIVGEGRGVLVPCIDYAVPGTWGGAEDKYPDIIKMAGQLQELYDDPANRFVIAQNGKAWARKQTWDSATDAVVECLDKVQAKRIAQVENTPEITITEGAAR
jgi:glycosyltransferase involved in cell wall biosynthesis